VKTARSLPDGCFRFSVTSLCKFNTAWNAELLGLKLHSAFGKCGSIVSQSFGQESSVNLDGIFFFGTPLRIPVLCYFTCLQSFLSLPVL
jgi:hypothetical protein